MAPEAILIAGANGSGKTTFARQFLPVLYPGIPFLNVDEIQREDTENDSAVAAGRILMRQLADLERQKQSFGIETTLSSRMYAKRIPLWKENQYWTILHFIEVPSDDYAVHRVALRVSAGGHSIPEADIRRRYLRGLTFFHEVYKPLVDQWYHWFSDDGGLRLVEHYRKT